MASRYGVALAGDRIGRNDVIGSFEIPPIDLGDVNKLGDVDGSEEAVCADLDRRPRGDR
jgi:hypothetical protein